MSMNKRNVCTLFVVEMGSFIIRSMCVNTESIRKKRKKNNQTHSAKTQKTVSKKRSTCAYRLMLLTRFNLNSANNSECKFRVYLLYHPNLIPSCKPTHKKIWRKQSEKIYTNCVLPFNSIETHEIMISKMFSLDNKTRMLLSRHRHCVFNSEKKG